MGISPKKKELLFRIFRNIWKVLVDVDPASTKSVSTPIVVKSKTTIKTAR